MRKRSDRPEVQVPDAKSDRPVWTKVGAVAVIGFVIGIAWPRLAGFQLGPTPPQEGKAGAQPSASGQTPKSTQTQAGSGEAATQPASSAAPEQKAPTPVQVQTVVVKHTDVLSCRNADNKAVDNCDRPDLDVLLMPVIKNLEKCPASAGLAGKLSIGFDVDFQRNRVQTLQGKSTTIPTDSAKEIWTCVAKDLKQLRIGSMRHDYRRYTLFYSAFFYPPGKLVDADGGDDAPRRDTRTDVAEDTSSASQVAQAEQSAGQEPIGTATIVYDTALVRDEPKTGKVVARLVRGTRVQLLSRKDSWYRIRFEQREGWIYRGALAQ